MQISIAGPNKGLRGASLALTRLFWCIRAMPPPDRAAGDPGEAREHQDEHEPAHRARELCRVGRRPRETAQTLRALGHPVPGRVAHEERKDERPDAVVEDEAEREAVQRDERCQHEQLTEL